MVDASRTDEIFVGCVSFFRGRRCPRLRFCGLGMGDLQVYQTLPKRLPINVPGFHRPGAVLLKMASSIRLASACAQSIRVALTRHLSWWLIRPALSAHARLPVLAGATWPCAWLLQCTGSAPRCRPFQLQRRAGGDQAWQERSPATLPLLRPSPRQRGQAVSTVRDAVRRRIARAPRLRRASSRVRACRMERFGGRLVAVRAW